MFAEVKTKDENKGVIVVGDTVNDIMDAVAEWIRDEKVSATDLQDAELLKKGSSVGTILFSETCPTAYSAVV